MESRRSRQPSYRAGACSRRSARGGRVNVPVALGVALAALFGAQSARATPFELEWSAPSECPSADFVKAEVVKVVGRPWQELGQPWQDVQARVTAEAGGYRLRVTLMSHAGGASQRDVLAASCTEAAEAAVAILTTGMAAGEGQLRGAPAGPALLAAPTADGSERSGAEDATQPPPGGVQPAATAPDLPRGDEPAAATSPGADAGPLLRPLLGARLGADLGTLASTAAFAQLTAGLELARFSLLGAFGITSTVLDEVRSSGAGAQMSLVMGSLSGCWQVTVGNPVLRACGGAELGSLEASGFGTAERREGHAFWSAGVAESALDWHISGASYAVLGVSAVVPFRQLHVALAPADIHRTSPIAVRPWLGLGLRFR